MTKNLKFKKESDNKWYIDLPNWPFAHHNLMMVAGADKLCALLSDDGENTSVEVVTSSGYDDTYKQQGYVVLRRTEWGLTTGAYYDVENIDGLKQLWLCPVTLFVYQKYPKFIYVRPMSEVA